MPHAMTDAFSVDDTLTDAAQIAPVTPVSTRLRQQESETPNERAMRAATAARKKAEPAKRQQG
jgi:hypothetical protein